MADVRLPPFTVGIDTRSSETALPPGAVRDALNVDFDRDGHAMRRPGAVPVESGAFHSLWQGKHRAFCVHDGELCAVDGGGVTPIFPLPSSAPLSYCDLNDRTIVSNPSWIGEVLPDLSVRPLGVPEGALTRVTAVSFGGLPAGRYAVAASYVRGAEEGALSPVQFVHVEEGGGIEVELPSPGEPVDAVRLYRSWADGEALYRADDLPAALTSFAMGAGMLGRAADTQHLRRTPAGSIVRAWHGRLLIGRNRTMYFTEPLRYGLYSARGGFVQEPSTITMIAPVEGGVFVGTRLGVSFYRGASPSEWTRVRLGASPPVQGTDALMPSSVLSSRFEVGDSSDLAIWLSSEGFVIGLPDGSLIQPQRSRIAGIVAQRGHTSFHGRRAISVVQ